MDRKRKESERNVIASSPNRRPYGAKLTLLLEKHTDFNIDGECIFLVSPQILVRIKPKEKRHAEDDKGWDIFVEGFATAGEAEQVGLKVALGFLWAAIQGCYSARLLYHTPLPCAIYNRTRSTGLTMSAFATVSITKGIANIVGPLDTIVSTEHNVDPRLLVALEIFTAARLETTERAKFVGIVSALEPIAQQEKYKSEELNELINNFKDQLNKADLDQDLKASLKGRIDQLCLESVSRAIKRLVRESLPDEPDVVEAVDEAYNLRSKILHEGSTDADLQEKSRAIEEIVRKIIEVKVSEYTSL